MTWKSWHVVRTIWFFPETKNHLVQGIAVIVIFFVYPCFSKPYTNFCPLGTHWSKMVCPIIESECSLSVRGILRFWGQKQKLNLTSILDHDKRSTQKKKWSLCSALSCSKESEQQTALTKIKWRTKELFNPVVDFSPKRVEIVGGGWCQIVMVFWDY